MRECVWMGLTPKLIRYSHALFELNTPLENASSQENLIRIYVHTCVCVCVWKSNWNYVAVT